MEKNVPTIMKSLLQSSELLQLPYPVLANSTLNQKLNIQAGQTLNPGEIPSMKYVMIGNGGLSIETGADNFSFTQSYNHKPTDTGLFNELPFIVRPISADLTDTIRANYRLRRVITIGGANYFAYYAKVLDLSSATTTLQLRSVQTDGTVGISDFTPGTANLSPTPTVLATGQTVTTNGNYVAASTQVNFVLNPTDITELLSACLLIYNNENHAVISEIALCSAVDRSVTVLAGGSQVTYTEAIATQVMSFLSTNFPAPSFSQGIKYTFDMGNSEPLLTVQ